MLLDTYAPLKRINKYKLKFKPKSRITLGLQKSISLKNRINKYKLKLKSKPWITLDLQKSISVKNKLLTKFINKKDPVLKKEFHTK